MKKNLTNTMSLLTMVLAIVMAFTTIAPLTAHAAATDPYCRISYDSSVGANTIKYYAYGTDGVAKLDNSHYVKFVNGVIADLNNQIITSKQMLDTKACWTSNGQYLVWIESDGTLMYRKYGTNTNVKLTDGAKTIELNAEDMLKSVTFADGSSKTTTELFASSTPTPSTDPTPTPSTDPTPTPSTDPTPTPSTDPTPTPSTDPTPNPTPTTSSNTVKEWTDSAGQEHFSFDGHEVVDESKNVYLDNYKISELCDSGVRYIGVDTYNRVYLYEDSTSSYYRFTISNMFKPDKIKFMAGTTLQSVITDNAGRLTHVVTSIGTFAVDQLIADQVWYPSKNYAINKSGYCQYYIAETSTVHILELKGTNLYLDGKQIATGITRTSESFGFNGSYLYYVKDDKAYRTKISDPTNSANLFVYSKTIHKLNYSTSNGLVSISGGSWYSTTNYVVNKSGESVYHFKNSTKTYTLTLISNRLYLGYKEIASGVTSKTNSFGFRGNYIYYLKGNKEYRTLISNPTKIQNIYVGKNAVSSLAYDASGFISPKSINYQTWYPGVSYVVKKAAKQTYVKAGTSKKYTLTRKGAKLYLGNRYIAKKVRKTNNSFGVKGNYIYAVKGKTAYRATLSAPTKFKVWKKKVTRLTYNSRGLVNGAQ